jgi:hypothetical protein
MFCQISFADPGWKNPDTVQDPGWKNPDPGSGMEALVARFFLIKFKIFVLQDCPGTLVASTSYQPVMTKL